MSFLTILHPQFYSALPSSVEKELPGYVHRMLYPIESFLAMARCWKHAAMAQKG
jgi:hypothetical protein